MVLDINKFFGDSAFDTLDLFNFLAKHYVNWELREEEDKLVLKYSKNKEELEYLENSYGKSILFTDNNFSAVEIIGAYHDKYLIEQKIRLLKNKHIISLT